MVPPDRDTPGINAMAWAKPSVMPSTTRMSRSSTRCRPTRSASPSSSPKTTSVDAISHRLRAAVWICSSNSTPSSPIGIVPMITSQASR